MNVNVRWRRRFPFRAGWLVNDSGHMSEYLFSQWRLNRVPRNVRDQALDQRMSDLIDGTSFLGWWHEMCAQHGRKYFLLHFHDGAWDIPWEWLVGRLMLPDLDKTVCLARTPYDELPIFEPSRFGKPLQILILQGDDGSSLGSKLDLDAEADAIINAWRGLEQTIQARIYTPLRRFAEIQTLGQVLDTLQPDLVWFSGHGRHSPKPGLLFADQKWIEPEEIGRQIHSATWKPKFWLLMSCDTIRGERTLKEFPRFVTQLFDAGALSVIGMQSPIRDVSACLLAREIMASLALGLSLDAGLAQARSVLRSVTADGVHKCDWAAPVIWSSTRLVERWHWESPNERMVQLQSVALEFLRRNLANPAQLIAISSDKEVKTAEAWIAARRTWVQGDTDEPELRARWLRVLQAIARNGPNFLVELVCSDNDIGRSLQSWAEVAYGAMLPGYVPEDLARAVMLLRSQPIAGWDALMRIQGLFVTVVDPPDFDSHQWFWRSLLTGTEHSFAILSPHSIPQALLASCATDKIGSALTYSAMSTAVGEAPRLARATALLREPLAYSSIKLIGVDSDEPLSLSAWPQWRSALVELPGGPVMSASARQHVQSLMTEAERRIAHLDCAQMLTQPEVYPTVRVREETLYHALSANELSAALIEAEALCVLYRDQDRPLGIIDLIRRLGPHALNIGPEATLPIAWAYSQLGKIDESDFWLRRAMPSSPLERAWAAGLRAENAKSRGGKKAAEAIDDAIAICEAALRHPSNDEFELRRRLRNYRQDRARIRHFLFHDLEGARVAYEELIGEWALEPEAAYDLAVVRRNYAECLRALARDSNDRLWLQARDELDMALALAQAYPQSPLLSEVLYEQSRVAESEHRDVEARDLLNKCMEAARQSGHYQVLAIAQARLFWNTSAFSFDEWQKHDAALFAFPHHGWAVRTLLNGRLRAAHRLAEAGKVDSAVRVLEGAYEVASAHLEFSGWSDGFRLAAISAGLHVLSRGSERGPIIPWNTAATNRLVQDYMLREGIHTPEEIWTKVQ
jgi:tetratricopeptide (TPR) repeat protein